MLKTLGRYLFAGALVLSPAVGQQGTGVAPSSGPPTRQNGASQVVPLLKGLVFLSKSEELAKDGVTASGVNTGGVPMLGDDFKDKMAAYLGHPLTFEGLDAITHEVIVYYRARSHPLVDAVAPAQDVSTGVIQIIVTEFLVGQVRAEGNRWFSDEIVTAPVTLHHGDEIDSQRLINQLDAANTNPFRRVNLVYQPSSEQGYTDIVLETQDRFPFRFYTGFDDNGTPATGRNRWDAGVTWGNALWHDQQLSFQISTSTDFFGGAARPYTQPTGATFLGQSLDWSMPIRGRDSISIFGLFDRSVPNVGQDFGLVAVSGQASIRYNLALRRTGSLIHNLALGYDFKTTNNNLQFGGTQVSRTNVEIDQFPLIYAANLTDKWGSTALTTSVTYSPGHLTPNNTDSNFEPGSGQSGRLLASSRYAYWRSDATRLTKLPEGSIWSLRVIGQTSTSNLLYTEQLAGGGPDILRGYDPNSVLADRGVIVSNELRSPSFHIIPGETAAWLGNWQALGFWDWAHLSAVSDAPGALNKLSASSAGMGVRYSWSSHISAKADWGYQLQHIPGSGNRDQLLSFGLMTSY
jgi:hemolysin activation/secretion protein